MGWQLIESQSLQASAASVTFSSIPQTYKALKFVASTRRDSSTGTGSAGFKFNTLSTNFTMRDIEGSGSTAGSYSSTNGDYGQCGEPTEGGYCSTEVTIPNYSGATSKPFASESVRETNATATYSQILAGLWSNTAAITSITCYPLQAGSNWSFGSTFTLYGLV